MQHVFLSYVSENSEQAHRLYDDLSTHGIKVWLDRYAIAPGTRWQRAIQKAINLGAFFIACFSREYNARDETFMNEEITIAIERLRRLPADRVWFIPVKFSPCEIPDRSIGAGESLQNIQYVDLHANWDAGVRRILEVIQPIHQVRLVIENKLRSVSPRARIFGAIELGVLRDARAVPALIELLNDEVAEIHPYAIRALGEIGDPKAVPALVEVLDSKHSEVCREAAAALSRIGGHAIAMAALKDTLRNGNAVARCCSAEALGALGDNTVVPDLIDALSDKEWQVREGVIHALAHINSPLASDALEAHLPTLAIALKDKNREVRRSAAHALRVICNLKAMPALIEALDHKDEEVRHIAASALSRMSQIKTLPELTSALLGALRNKDKWVRFEAADALARMGDVNAIPVITKFLSAENSTVRIQAVIALCRIGEHSAMGAEQVVPLIIGMLSDKESPVRYQAAYSLREIGSPQALEAAREFYDRDKMR